nr:hypothetical protein [Tanacetum cinerariifolium]
MTAFPNYTLDTPHSDEESEPIEASKTRIALPSDSTSPLSLNHPLTQTSPNSTPSQAFYYRSIACMAVRTQTVLSPGISARVTEAMALSLSSFRKRYKSSYKTHSPPVSPASSLTLPIQKRYQGTSKLILDNETEDDESKAEGTGLGSEESGDEGPSLEGEEVTSEQQQAVSVKNTVADEPLGLGYKATRRHALELAEDPVPSTFDVGHSSSSLSVSPASLTIPSLVALQVTTLAATIAIDEDEFIKGDTCIKDAYAADQHEMQGLRERVATLKRRMDRFER